MRSMARTSAERHVDTRMIWVALGAVYVIWSTTYLAIRVSAHTTPPFPPTIRSSPTIVEARHWGRPGRSPTRSPRRIVSA